MEILSSVKEIKTTLVVEYTVQEVEAALLKALGRQGGTIEWCTEDDYYGDGISAAKITVESFENINT